MEFMRLKIIHNGVVYILEPPAGLVMEPNELQRVKDGFLQDLNAGRVTVIPSGWRLVVVIGG